MEEKPALSLSLTDVPELKRALSHLYDQLLVQLKKLSESRAEEKERFGGVLRVVRDELFAKCGWFGVKLESAMKGKVSSSRLCFLLKHSNFFFFSSSHYSPFFHVMFGFSADG